MSVARGTSAAAGLPGEKRQQGCRSPRGACSGERYSDGPDSMSFSEMKGVVHGPVQGVNPGGLEIAVVDREPTEIIGQAP